MKRCELGLSAKGLTAAATVVNNEQFRPEIENSVECEKSIASPQRSQSIALACSWNEQSSGARALIDRFEQYVAMAARANQANVALASHSVALFSKNHSYANKGSD